MRGLLCKGRIQWTGLIRHQSTTSMNAPMAIGDGTPEFAAFLDRLRADGGDKILEFRSNVLHMDPSRLYHLCNDVKGLSLSQALRQAKWHAGNPGLRLMEALSESVVKAKESGFDLSKTFVADACVTANKAIISERLKKLYIRGRGRYGAIPHPKTALLSLLLQEREKPFESREKDELEYLRERLRNAQKDWVPSPDEIYAQKRAARPLKEIHS